MTTGYITHPDFLKHEMGSHHPECPERIQAINDQLIRSGIDRFLHHLDAPLATGYADLLPSTRGVSR